VDIALWIAQALLGLAFLAGGFLHAFRFERFAANPRVSGWAREVGRSNMRRIGLLEMAGGIGVILPPLTGVLPWLSPLAATGLGLVMLSAVVFHVRRGEYPAMASNGVLGALAAFVAVGRAFIEPI
jgi:uncharacterized membrane protein YphA (DoxX/SURF4 family)